MRCSVCNKEGHNVCNCPLKDKEELRNFAIWVKIDNLTEREAADLQAQFIKEKTRIAPKGRATSAKDDVKKLPERIRAELKLNGGDNDTKTE